jgi:hypothetical protein
MSTLIEFAEIVWRESKCYEFACADVWDDGLFTASWATQNGVSEAWSIHDAGWYWFEAQCSLDALLSLQRPPQLPKKGIDFGDTARKNVELFESTLLCQPDSVGWMVLYNGHEGNITGRVRTHFNLNNDNTGALGLKHYGLSSWKWRIRLFSASGTRELAEPERKALAKLAGSTIGRGALETVWRGKYGWPALCKM